ncbi:MAG: hypothetical protein JO327_04070 [Nitrososphaeraceae archaeon]|nr:hypothetical protein [Nitrososphaeraceae archaeon]
MSGKSLDRAILRGESIELFRAAIRSPSTRDPYERRLIGYDKSLNPTKFSRRILIIKLLLITTYGRGQVNHKWFLL